MTARSRHLPLPETALTGTTKIGVLLPLDILDI
jgi:hypothetical protein